jgi:hypothetical protein
MHIPFSSPFLLHDSHASFTALMGSVLLENPEVETRWYFRYFLGQTHENYVTTIANSTGARELVILSMMFVETSTPTPDSALCRCILWRKMVRAS